MKVIFLSVQNEFFDSYHVAKKWVGFAKNHVFLWLLLTVRAKPYTNTTISYKGK